MRFKNGKARFAHWWIYASKHGSPRRKRAKDTCVRARRAEDKAALRAYSTHQWRAGDAGSPMYRADFKPDPLLSPESEAWIDMIFSDGTGQADGMCVVIEDSFGDLFAIGYEGLSIEVAAIDLAMGVPIEPGESFRYGIANERDPEDVVFPEQVKWVGYGHLGVGPARLNGTYHAA